MSEDDWVGEPRGEPLEAPMMAQLGSGQDRQPAAMLLFFLLDNTENGIIHKLWDEAKFDRLIKYDLGELNED